MWQTEAGITPQTCTARREPRYSSITIIGTTFHIQYRSIQTKVNTAPHPHNPRTHPPRHNVPHPTPKHTDKSQHRTPHHNPRTQNPFGTTFRIQHRSIQTKVNTAPHPHNPRTLKKKPEGCAEGPWLYGPFAVFPQLPKAKKQAFCQESKNKPNHTINKEK